MTLEIAKQIKEARESKSLSQKELSRISGIPQSHISKIESGVVDLRISSLNELARALEMELTLVPIKALPAINSIISTTSKGTQQKKEQQLQRQLAKELTLLAETLNAQEEETSSTVLIYLEQLNNNASDLEITEDDIKKLKTFRNMLVHSAGNTLKSTHKALEKLLEQLVKRQLIKRQSNRSKETGIYERSAYSLADDYE